MFRVFSRNLAVISVVAAGSARRCSVINRAEAQDCTSGDAASTYQFTGSLTQCQITVTGTYAIAAVGGDGGAQRIDALTPVTTAGGLGFALQVEFALQAGDTLQILVGGAGARQQPELLAGETFAGGGGGGTFVSVEQGGDLPDAILVAGGGGGAGTDSAGENGRGVGAGGGRRNIRMAAPAA